MSVGSKGPVPTQRGRDSMDQATIARARLLLAEQLPSEAAEDLTAWYIYRNGQLQAVAELLIRALELRIPQ